MAVVRADPDDPDQDEKYDDALHECRLLFFPFITQLQRAVEDPSAPSVVGAVAPSDKDGAYRMQLKTVGGALVPLSHDQDYISYSDPPEPVLDPAPNVPKVAADKVRVEKELRRGMAIVSVDGERLFLKQVYGVRIQSSFIREATILSRLPAHERVVTLVGLVVLPSGAVDGMLLQLIDGVSLQDWRAPDGKPVDPDLKRQWLTQIEEGLAHVHDNKQVWGDVKASNVLIDTDGNAHLIDFDGGFSPGWVPMSLCETLDGDIEGMRKMEKFLCSIV